MSVLAHLALLFCAQDLLSLFSSQSPPKPYTFTLEEVPEQAQLVPSPPAEPKPKPAPRPKPKPKAQPIEAQPPVPEQIFTDPKPVEIPPEALYQALAQDQAQTEPPFATEEAPDERYSPPPSPPPVQPLQSPQNTSPNRTAPNTEHTSKLSAQIPQLKDGGGAESAPEKTTNNGDLDTFSPITGTTAQDAPEHSPQTLSDQNPLEFVPSEIAPDLALRPPQKTTHDGIDFALNTYAWNFSDYMENWAYSLKKWWRTPSDYAAGKVPQGGAVWIRVTIAKDGSLDNYKIYHTDVTPEMQLKVVQALTSSFPLSALPLDFPSETLVANWRFIYLPYGVIFDHRRP